MEALIMQNPFNYQSHFGHAIDNLMEGFQLISYDWRYLYLNDAIVAQSQFSREELIGYTMMEKYPGIETTPLFATMKKCMNERINETLDNYFEYPDKTTAWFELRIHPVPEGLLILSVDITARKNAEEKHRKYISDLEKMIYMTSHQIRQPVANILGIVRQLELPGQSTEELKLLNRYIRQSAASLDTLTRELAAYIESLRTQHS